MAPRCRRRQGPSALPSGLRSPCVSCLARAGRRPCFYRGSAYLTFVLTAGFDCILNGPSEDLAERAGGAAASRVPSWVFSKGPPTPQRKARAEKRVDVLDRDTYFERARAARLRTNPDDTPISAMYSSLVNGIVTEPELMVVPLDDHAFLRGHAVFDTATLAGGRVCRLGIHLRRFFESAEAARLRLPFGLTEEDNKARMTEIICDTCVASGLRRGAIRFFLTAGPGNFGITSVGCEPAFYCVVYSGGVGGAPDSAEPIDECTVRLDRVPMKPPLLARVKSNNYMLNCLTAMSAQDRGGIFGISVRSDNTIAEGSVVNVIVVTRDRVMLTPQFGDILSGSTVSRAMELAREHLVGEGMLLNDVRQETVALATAKAAAEVCLAGADTQIISVKRLDGDTIGDGRSFPVAEALRRLLTQDIEADTGDQIKLDYSE